MKRKMKMKMEEVTELPPAKCEGPLHVFNTNRENFQPVPGQVCSCGKTVAVSKACPTCGHEKLWVEEIK